MTAPRSTTLGLVRPPVLRSSVATHVILDMRSTSGAVGPVSVDPLQSAPMIECVNDLALSTVIKDVWKAAAWSNVDPSATTATDVLMTSHASRAAASARAVIVLDCGRPCVAPMGSHMPMVAKLNV